MPELSRPDGTRIHFEVQGSEGPSVVLATYWSWIPGIWAELLADLAADHRVFVYHLRGTGNSSGNGPFDMETDTGDLEAVVEEAGGPALLLSTADSANRASRLTARRPELVGAAISFGTAPLSRAAFVGREGMIASNTVVDAFFEMLETNYRGGIRTLMEATNPESSEDQLRERVQTQTEFAPADAAIPRFRAWIDDDPREEARAAGERLWIFAASGVAGPWLPPTEELAQLTAEIVPQANVVQIDPGPISAPHETAEAVRRVSAPLRAGVAEGRK